MARLNLVFLVIPISEKVLNINEINEVQKFECLMKSTRPAREDDVFFNATTGRHKSLEYCAT